MKPFGGIKADTKKFSRLWQFLIQKEDIVFDIDGKAEFVFVLMAGVYLECHKSIFGGLLLSFAKWRHIQTNTLTLG